MERGYVKLWRKTLDSGLLAHPKAWQVFGYLLLNAAWKPTTYATIHGVVKLAPGQIATGRKKMASALKMSEQNIRTALAMLANLEIISIESTSTHSTITLKNWALYQSDQPSPNQAPTKPQPTPNQHLTTVKEGKKESIKEQTNKTAASAAWQSDSDFMQFWNAWPRSCRKGSPVPAYRAWLKNKPPLADVLAFLAWKRREPIWTNTDPQGKDFIPMPSTFLNGAGWLEQKESGRGNGTGRMERPAGIKFDDKGEVIF